MSRRQVALIANTTVTPPVAPATLTESVLGNCNKITMDKLSLVDLLANNLTLMTIVVVVLIILLPLVNQAIGQGITPRFSNKLVQMPTVMPMMILAPLLHVKVTPILVLRFISAKLL